MNIDVLGHRFTDSFRYGDGSRFCSRRIDRNISLYLPAERDHGKWFCKVHEQLALQGDSHALGLALSSGKLRTLESPIRPKVGIDGVPREHLHVAIREPQIHMPPVLGRDTSTNSIRLPNSAVVIGGSSRHMPLYSGSISAATAA